MTTLTATSRHEPRTVLRAVPWRRMAWVIWRQHRLLLAGVGATFGAVAVYLLIMGLQIHDAYATLTACHPADSSACQQLTNQFFETYAPGAGITQGLLQLLPALIGAFAGAPVLAREFETGTFRFAWTQGFGRTRWAVANLVSLAVIVTVPAALISSLFSWYYQPLIAAGDNNGALFPTVFDLSGVALAAWTLTAFSMGALAGALIRKVTPAMFATLAVWAGLAVLIGGYLRAHYLAPVVTTSLEEPHPAWILSQLWTLGDKPASLDMINNTLRAIDAHANTLQNFSPGPATPAGVDPLNYLTQHGYALFTTYQPDSRFWTFQWIEASWLLCLSLLLLGATVWLIRRRAS